MIAQKLLSREYSIKSSKVYLPGNPRRGFPTKKHPLDVFSTLLRLMTQRRFASCGTRRGRCPSTPPPFEKGRRVPVAHKQGADRSGSEELIETFRVCIVSFCRVTLAFNLILARPRRIQRRFAAEGTERPANWERQLAAR